MGDSQTFGREVLKRQLMSASPAPRARRPRERKPRPIDPASARHGRKFSGPTAMTKNPPEGISVGLADDDDMYTWEVMIIGPDGTLYEGGM